MTAQGCLQSGGFALQQLLVLCPLGGIRVLVWEILDVCILERETRVGVIFWLSIGVDISRVIGSIIIFDSQGGSFLAGGHDALLWGLVLEVWEKGALICVRVVRLDLLCGRR